MDDQKNYGHEAFIQAARNGDLSELDRLYTGVEDLDFLVRHEMCFSGQVTALSEASKHGHLACIQKLVEMEAGVECNKRHMVRYHFAMEMAAINGHLDCFRFLVVNRLFKSDSDKNRYGDFLELCRTGDFYQLHALLGALEDKAILNGWKGNNLMSLFVVNGCPPYCVQEFVDNGVDINGLDYNGFTCLMCAVLVGNVTCIRYILALGAGINVSTVEDCSFFLSDGTTRPDNDNCSVDTTALMYAASCVSSKSLSGMLPFLSTEHINYTNDQHWLPLMLAIYFGRKENYCLLVGRSVWSDSNDAIEHTFHSLGLTSADEDGVTVEIRIKLNHSFHRSKSFHACVCDCAPLHNILNGVYGVNVEEIDNTLMTQAVGKDMDSVRWLLNTNVSIDARDESGKTVLMKCAESRKGEMVDLLLKRGSDVNIRDEHKETAVIFAAKSHKPRFKKPFLNRNDPNEFIDEICEGRKESEVGHSLHCLTELVSYGASIDVKNDLGDTPLMVASGCGNEEFMVSLIKLGADVEARSDDGMTSVFYCRTVECLQTLLDHGACVHVKDLEGKTPLMYLCDMGRDEVVQLLLQQGVDVDAQDKKGKTAVMYAAENNHAKCLQLLLDAHADVDIVDNEGKTAVSFVMCDCRSSLELLSRKVLTNGEVKPQHRRAIMECDNKGKLRLKDILKAIELGLFEWEMGRYKLDHHHHKDLIFSAVSKGIGPGMVNYKGFDMSMLPLAFLRHDLSVVKFLLAHRYFFPEDYAILSTNKSFRDQLEYNKVSEMLDLVVLRPLSLQTWSFLTVSKAVSLAGPVTKWSDRVDALPVPDSIKKALKFQTSMSNLCCLVWDNLSTEEAFDSLNFRKEMSSQWEGRECGYHDDCEFCRNYNFEPKDLLTKLQRHDSGVIPVHRSYVYL